MLRPKDESYIIDLCDELLGLSASRGHCFPFLLGDSGRSGRHARLPVDAYYPSLKLVIEYHERQHSEPSPFFDRRPVPSGGTRGEQRQRYDQRRREVLPRHGISLLVLDYREFLCDGRKRLRRDPSDRDVVRARLRTFQQECSR